MTKAVYFDWFNTLATYDPPREELYRQAFKTFNVDLPLSKIVQGLLVGDSFFFSESGKALVRGKSHEERERQYVRYAQAICEAGGITLAIDAQTAIIRTVLQQFTGIFALFPAVLPLFRQLKEKGYVVGIISNADRSIREQIERTELKLYLDVLVTSDDAGAEKPAAPIFRAALERTGIGAKDAVYVGDQYRSDILGARAVGMGGILVDRYDLYPEVTDCPRIQDIKEVPDFLQS